jgi:hypothetical protein
MTDHSTIWIALQKHLPKNTWIPFAEILETVRARVFLDAEDLERTGNSTGAPRWEANVRSLLRIKSRAGSVRARDGQGPPRAIGPQAEP